MSKRKQPRRTRPHELARIDQVLAEAREKAVTCSYLTMVKVFAEPGMECSYDTCQEEAMFVVHFALSRPEECQYPVCRAHLDDLMAELIEEVNKQITPETPWELHRRDEYGGDW